MRISNLNGSILNVGYTINNVLRGYNDVLSIDSNTNDCNELLELIKEYFNKYYMLAYDKVHIINVCKFNDIPGFVDKLKDMGFVELRTITHLDDCFRAYDFIYVNDAALDYAKQIWSNMHGTEKESNKIFRKIRGIGISSLPINNNHRYIDIIAHHAVRPIKIRAISLQDIKSLFDIYDFEEYVVVINVNKYSIHTPYGDLLKESALLDIYVKTLKECGFIEYKCGYGDHTIPMIYIGNKAGRLAAMNMVSFPRIYNMEDIKYKNHITIEDDSNTYTANDISSYTNSTVRFVDYNINADYKLTDSDVLKNLIKNDRKSVILVNAQVSKNIYPENIYCMNYDMDELINGKKPIPIREIEAELERTKADLEALGFVSINEYCQCELVIPMIYTGSKVGKECIAKIMKKVEEFKEGQKK